MSNAKQIDQLLEGFLKRGLPGCGLKVVQYGNTLYEGYFGVTDIDTKTPVTKDTLFRQASMSKIPLYTVMMMLYERGKFLLTDPIGDYLPEWKTSTRYDRHPNGYVDIVPTSRPINIRDVMSMKCGLPYCNSAAPTHDLVMTGMQECMQPLWEKGSYTLKDLPCPKHLLPVIRARTGFTDFPVSSPPESLRLSATNLSTMFSKRCSSILLA